MALSIESAYNSARSLSRVDTVVKQCGIFRGFFGKNVKAAFSSNDNVSKSHRIDFSAETAI